MRIPRLSWCLFLVVFVPALAFAWRSDQGEIAFILYREPKLMMLRVLGWAFLALLWWKTERRLDSSRLVSTLSQPAVALLGLWLLWSGITVAWVLVHENLVYEFDQYLLLYLLLVSLLAQPAADLRWRRAVEGGLIAGVAALTAIGLFQALGALPSLLPIETAYGGSNPSLMGYKNPMALTLLGQIFLVAGRATEASGKTRYGWFLLLAVEILYLAMLQSRTSLLALAAGCVVLIPLDLLRRRAGGARGVPISKVVVGVALCVAAVAAGNPGVRDRVASAARILGSPSSYLETDRGVYLQNTLQMTRYRPWGVGLGDWQTHYPVYRRVDRYRAYDDHVQVRRAHSDHVQILGETGWLGLFLWTGFWVTALGFAIRRALSRDAPQASIFSAAQLFIFVVALATDYVIEIPFVKLELFVVLYLCLHDPRRHEGPAPRSDRAGRLWPKLAISMVAIVAAIASSLALEKAFHAATLQRHYLLALNAEGARATRHLEQAGRAGAAFARLPGHEKTFYRSWLVLADTRLRLGQPDLAEVAAQHALDLHPFNPGTYRWLAALAEDGGRAEESAAWQALYREVLHESDSGPPLLPTR